MAKRAAHGSPPHRPKGGARTKARGGVPAGRAFLAAALTLAPAFAAVLARGGAGASQRERADDSVVPVGAVSSVVTPDGGAGAAPAVTAGASAEGVVDSIFPTEEEIRRFRVGLPEVAELSGGAPSRDELVDRFLRAVETADTTALVPLLLDRSEFGWLYYPHTMYTAPPYRLSPAFLWFQMQNLTDSGLVRVFKLAERGPLHAKGYRCEATPGAEGPNRVWKECVVILHPPGTEPVEMRLFGSVLERGGTYKFVSFASSL